MNEILIKMALLLVGLSVGFGLFRNNERVKNMVSNFVFNWLLPYVIFMEISSMALTTHWWSYSLMGAAFILIPFFAGFILFRLTKHQSVLIATAEGGTMGFVVYALIGSEPLAHFFLVDMIGNGLSLFLIIFPILMEGKRTWNHTFTILVSVMVIGMAANFVGFHPLLAFPAFASIEPSLVAVLVFSIALVLGAGVVIRTSKEILTSRFFQGFWLYRGTLLVMSLLMGFPLAVTILAVLPPSFMLPIFFRTQGFDKESTYASSFIASCLPFSVALSIYLFMK